MSWKKICSLCDKEIKPGEEHTHGTHQECHDKAVEAAADHNQASLEAMREMTR